MITALEPPRQPVPHNSPLLLIAFLSQKDCQAADPVRVAVRVACMIVCILKCNRSRCPQPFSATTPPSSYIMSQPGQARWSAAPPTGMMGTAINTRRPPIHSMAQGHTTPVPPPPPPPTLNPYFSQPYPRTFPTRRTFATTTHLPHTNLSTDAPPSQPTPHHTTAHTTTASPSHTHTHTHTHTIAKTQLCDIK